MVVTTPNDPQQWDACTGTYWPYVYTTTISITNTTIMGNAAPCLLCTGGGLHLERGGAVALRLGVALVALSVAPSHVLGHMSRLIHGTQLNALSRCDTHFLAAMSPSSTTLPVSLVVGCPLVLWGTTRTVELPSRTTR